MRSSSGAHYIALDHVRALAALLVCVWHFTHSYAGSPVPFDYIPALFPLALLDEGHTGVSLFMTLSGYLFAKLLDGKTINYAAFIWNRGLRLLPLLLVVILITGILKFQAGESMSSYASQIALGSYFPSLPNGGWSVTVELHYYIVLPLFLLMLRKSRFLPLLIIVAAFALRWFIYHAQGGIQFLAYFTIIGRIDQFALGMFVYHFRSYFARRHVLAVAILTGFTIFYWYFDLSGGFYQRPSYPSTRPLWLFLLTIEGIAYAIGIAWYEGSFSHSTTGVSKLIGRMGELSYSFYLLHTFVVFGATKFVHERIMNISNFYLSCVWSLIFFLLMMPVMYLSYRFIEMPFLKLRKRYIVATHNSLEAPSQTIQQGSSTETLKQVAEV
jgi:peptidoglycan/LPS O-acetylase OafA/YrhL